MKTEPFTKNPERVARRGEGREGDKETGGIAVLASQAVDRPRNNTSHLRAPSCFTRNPFGSRCAWSFRIFLLCLGVATLAGCSRFEKDWRAAAKAGDATRSIAGRWAGTWRSDVNGHTDALRCLIRPLTNGVFEARYHARYRKGLLRLTFQYAVPLSVTDQGDAWQFAGAANLGWLAGVYRYAGGVTNGQFRSSYDSQYDRGWFEMERVPQAK